MNNLAYSEKSKLFKSKLFRLKSPISKFSGITKGIIKFFTFIWIESPFPSPVVSIVNTLSFGGKIFLISTLNADKSNVIFHQPINLY